MTTPEALFGVVPFGRVDFGEEWHGKASARLERVTAWHGIWQGYAGQGESWRGWARILARLGKAGLGRAWLGMSTAWNMARRGVAWLGPARQGAAWPGTAWNMARRGEARPGMAWNLARLGTARLGRARHERGMEYGGARHGEAWHGEARRGWAWHGMWRGGAGRGLAGRGRARQGTWAGTSARTTNQHNTMEQTHSKALMAYAGQLYDAYMRGCGGIDWLDKPLPSWADYVCNPNNKRRVEAWVDVARVAIKIETEVRDNAL